MKEQHQVQDKTTNEQQKLAWSTPELEVFSVKDRTLAGGREVSDGGAFS
ncbi:hypothetical protein [Emticicia sp. 17c]